jgi:hypothetical protein
MLPPARIGSLYSAAARIFFMPAGDHGGRLIPRLPRSVVASYLVRNSPRHWSTGTTRSMKRCRSRGYPREKTRYQFSYDVNRSAVGVQPAGAAQVCQGKHSREALYRLWQSRAAGRWRMPRRDYEGSMHDALGNGISQYPYAPTRAHGEAQREH